MKKTLFSTLFFIAFCLPLSAQFIETGNDWIKPGQTYIKIVVDEDGVYRIAHSDLASVGFDLSTVNPDELHLFWKGEEQPLFIRKNIAGQLDYFDFIGKANDGEEDRLIYKDPYTGETAPWMATRLNAPIFSKESAYFLTWDSSPALRFSEHVDTTYSTHVPEEQFRTSISVDLPEVLNFGSGSTFDMFNRLNIDYGPGEGYLGEWFSNTTSRDILVETPYPASTPSHSTRISARVLGHSDYTHDFEISFNGDVVGTDNYLGVGIKTYYMDYYDTLSHINFLTFANNWSSGTVIKDWVNEITVDYNREFNLNGEDQIKMLNWVKGTDAYFHFENASGSDSCWVYDLTTLSRSSGIVKDGPVTPELDVIIPGGTTWRELCLVTDAGIKSPLRFESTSISNLSDPGQGAKFIILTHSSLAASAYAYKNYRDTTSFNGMSAKVVFTDQIWDEFGYGLKTPMAIKRFCLTAAQNWTEKPEYLMIWGKGKVPLVGDTLNFVPTWGQPASDFEYVSNFRTDTFLLDPVMAVGRVNIHNDSEGFTYLAKVADYERTGPTIWRNKGLYLVGGGNTSEWSYLNSFATNWKNTYEGFYGGLGYYYQNTDTGVHTTHYLPEDSVINEGVGIIQTFGHATAAVFDVNLKEADQYENWGKYPIVIAFGCSAGDFASYNRTFSERFLLEPGRGGIAFISPTGSVYGFPIGYFGNYLHDQMFNYSSGLSIGQIYNISMGTFMAAYSGNQFFKLNARLVALQGDPSLTVDAPLATATTEGPEGPGNGMMQLHCYPNPFSEKVTVEYTKEQGSEVQFILTNLNGQVVRQLRAGDQASGQLRMEVDSQSGGPVLTDGMYILSMIVDGQMAGTQKLIFAR